MCAIVNNNHNSAHKNIESDQFYPFYITKLYLFAVRKSDSEQQSKDNPAFAFH